MSAQTYVAEQFRDQRQQHEAARLGMWVFLGTEVMLFGAIFASILIYRVTYWEALQTATQHMHVWIGGANTAILLTSSLTMGFAVLAAREGAVSRTFWYLVLSALLGVLFIGLKLYEYYKEFHEGLMPGVGPAFPLNGPSQLFYNIYFAATGLHAVHLSCGIGTVAIFACLVRSGRLPLPAREMMIEGVGMYWGLVDIVWIFLYPSLYLL